jgi:putative hydrolase of HD superfamily
MALEGIDTMNSRLSRQIAFLVEIDKVKQILRRTRLYDHSRYENDAEHGWHMCMMALVLSEYADDPDIDIGKVLRMALIHDIVEIDAGDQYLYSGDKALQQQKEKEAAQRIFGILPKEQCEEFTALWEEFEARETSEAKFAKAIDRLGPLMQEHSDNGHAWKMHGVTAGQVRAVNSIISDGSREIGEFARGIIEDAIARGDLGA